MTVTVQDIFQARSRLRPYLTPTPLEAAPGLGQGLLLKLEQVNPTHSFKVRGALNAVLSLDAEAQERGIVTASSGNHAQALAYAAHLFGLDARIVMPRHTPRRKIDGTRRFGVDVVLHGDFYDDAERHARLLEQEEGRTFISPYNDTRVIAGAGTCGLELLEQAPDLARAIVPVGGGGLLAGMAACVKQINPRVRVIGVQASGADAMVKSFCTKKDVCTDAVSTIADGIAVKKPGVLTSQLIREHVDEMVTVTDDEIASTILLLLERTKMVVEPAGAAALAAALGHDVELSGKRAVCVLSGGNIDVGFIHKVVEKGLVTRGRQMKFQTVMPDIPGSLYRFSEVMVKCGANIIMVQHDRLSTNLAIGDAILHVACEVTSREHGQELIRQLEAAGYRIVMES